MGESNFQVSAVTTWNDARSPAVERRIDGMISWSVDADLSRRLDLTSATRRQLSIVSIQLLGCKSLMQ